MEESMAKVCIIGGGAAGMMAAVAAAGNGHEVHLYEKNEKLGKKLFITGKGRCNVTNASDLEVVFQNVVTNPKFLYSALYTFTNDAMMEFLEENGVPLKVERGNRVFPASDKSSDVIKGLERALKKAGVYIHLGMGVKELLLAEQHRFFLVLQDKTKVSADAVIVTTGGCSYESTGSTGDGYRFAKSVGHTLKKPLCALVPLEVRETYASEMMGLSLKNVSVTMTQGKKTLYSGFGEMLFTHFGVSGPLILSGSSYVTKVLEQGEVELTIDLKPALTEEQLDKRLLREFGENHNKAVKNIWDSMLPKKMIPVYLDYCGIDGEKKVNSITKEERSVLIQGLKAFKLTITGARSFKEAIITQGGITVKEINPATMESKLVKGLYFAGEVLDVDALTGGYNLQIAWSTGYLAGISIE
jgi:hypothetical protein